MRVLGIIFILLLLAGCGGEPVGSGATAQSSEPRTKTTDTGDATHPSELRTVTLNASSGEEVKVRVEIADSQPEWVIGLRWRKRLPENRGMLFVYAEEKKLNFTMENTVIPLSIAFMDSEGRIVDIQDMEPLEVGPYVSAKPAQYALEVNQGFFEEQGVDVGDRAELPA